MVWAMIAATALVTLALRFSFLGTLKPHALPERLRVALQYVPPAVFAAIVLPQVLVRDGALDAGLDNPRIAAALVAIAVARLTRSMVWTIVAGMVALWVAQWGLA
jgi:branched-subunit amino acid transport protein